MPDNGQIYHKSGNLSLFIFFAGNLQGIFYFIEMIIDCAIAIII